jgi:hypothetical protein
VLNEAFGFRWSWDITDTMIIPDLMDPHEVIVHGRLTVTTPDGGTVVKEQFGSADVKRYKDGRVISLGDDLNPLMSMLGGHPYLVRVALYQLATERHTLDALLATAPTEEGPYAEHLRRHLQNLEASPDLLAAMQTVLQADGPVKVGNREAFRLRSMGVVKFRHNAVEPLCDLYRIAFRDRLV